MVPTPPELPPLKALGRGFLWHRPWASVEHSSLRGRYAPEGDLLIQREVNDETCSDRYRKCGSFGSGRLGTGGECTADGYSLSSLSRLRPGASLVPCASLCPFPKTCPPSLPSLCSSDLSHSDLWRSWRSSFDVCR